jgi:hypothetical protein
MPLVRQVVTEVGGFETGIALDVPASEVIILTGGTGLKDPSGQASGLGGQLLGADVFNSHASVKRLVQLFLVADGDTPSDANLIFEETLAPREMVRPRWRPPEKYKDSATLQGNQDVGTDVIVSAMAAEFY